MIESGFNLARPTQVESSKRYELESCCFVLEQNQQKLS